MQYASFFVPAKKNSMGAVVLKDIRPASSLNKVTKVAPNLSVWTPQPASSGVAGRILDLGPVGILGLVAATAAVGYFIVKSAR